VQCAYGGLPAEEAAVLQLAVRSSPLHMSFVTADNEYGMVEIGRPLVLQDVGSGPQGPKASALLAAMARIVGDPGAVELEHRLLNGVLFLAALAGAVSTLSNLVIGTSALMLASTLFCLVAGAICYVVSVRSVNWRRLLLPIYVVFLALLGCSWITQAGTYGTIGYYLFLLVCYSVVLLRGPQRILALLVTAGTVAALLLLELAAPALILPYATPMQRFADVAFALPLCLSMTGGFVALVYREYQRERHGKDAVLHLMTVEKERVERAMREKQRLLTMVCHDIANALTVLSVEISSVQSDRSAEDLHSEPSNISSMTLERMGYACGNIDEIISSVRMMEAIEQGRLLLDLKPADLFAVFRNAEVIFADRLARKRLTLQLPTLGPDTRVVLAEPRILANQVFGNLISNAIKFSAPGSTITVAVARSGATTTLSVTDHGVGIPKEILGRLFDSDAKVSRPGTNGEPGTGFGLRTVKYFVELFGGRIEIVSSAEQDDPTNHGTSVRVHLACSADQKPKG
jgi:signal transduction histidine kinase